MTQTLLAIENLSVGFRHQQTVRTVVNDVSLQIAAGETLALVGESGSGKSVTALSILRLLPCPPVEYLSGDIRFHGESLLHASDQTLRGVRGNKIAMIFQEPMTSLNPVYTNGFQNALTEYGDYADPPVLQHSQKDIAQTPFVARSLW